MRSKENAHDYRYFPEPDLPPIEISSEWIEKIKNTLPEMAKEKQNRYMTEYELPQYDTQMITSQKALADFFEETVSICQKPKEVSNWIMGDLMRLLKEKSIEVKEMIIKPKSMAKIIDLVDKGTINRKIAKDIFEKAFENNIDIDEYIKSNSLHQVSDTELVKSVINKIFEANPKSLEDYKAGKQKLLVFWLVRPCVSLKEKQIPQ
jgi:aspartyl-tRNA(Asn)/glutamyl-tRNA(Gln) amidotransferase subunit B